MDIPPNSPAVLFNLLHQFLNPTPISGELFADSIALADQRVLIGSFVDTDGAVTGGNRSDVAYLFDATTGTLIRTIANPDPPSPNPLADEFGFAVAMDGTQALIGAPKADTVASNAGAAYLFDATTGDLRQTFVNPASSADDEFGHALTLDRDRVLIGAPYADQTVANGGAAYLFDGTTGKLLQTFVNPNPEAGAMFGDGVALSDNRVLVAAFLEDAGETNSGAVYLYDGTTGKLLQTFVNPTPNRGDLFGRAVAMDGTHVLISAPFDGSGAIHSGRVYLFDGATGKLLQTFVNPDPSNGSGFGLSVAIQDNQVLIGASSSTSSASNSGIAYLFDANTGELLQTFADPTPAEGDLFGNAVAIDRNALLIGAIGNDDGGENSGAAYLFQQSQPRSTSGPGEDGGSNGRANGRPSPNSEVVSLVSPVELWSINFDQAHNGSA